MIEDILKNKPGGERIMNEYARTKSLTDARRRDMKFCVCLTLYVSVSVGQVHQGVLKRNMQRASLPCSQTWPILEQEHYYNAEDGSGYLAWRLKCSKGSIRGTKEDPASVTNRGPFTEANCLTTESLCCEAIALMKHSADEAIVKEKMKQTFTYRQKMLHDPVKSSEIFTAFPRFLDIPGMIEQDFNLMFGDVTSAKFLEKWPTVYKKKVIDQSRGLTQTGDLQDLVQNAGSTTEVENGTME
ncbi:hypothetical protein F7725_019403 [Dissostichus mawsoni]|uniref:Uncharacterized protein n=1 Tax=Dissostichus mawsoni TaxID=36200 RepID=A0A7J5YJM4_DISMA|nr:hypothetical protein F7725_019403 [Dissostichus mawsoni]